MGILNSNDGENGKSRWCVLEFYEVILYGKIPVFPIGKVVALG
jgi:hypothetical protein